MTKMATGKLEGNVVTLDHAVPPLEGQRVRVVLEPLADSELELSADEQTRLWEAWVDHGPQGPIEDEGEPASCAAGRGERVSGRRLTASL